MQCKCGGVMVDRVEDKKPYQHCPGCKRNYVPPAEQEQSQTAGGEDTLPISNGAATTDLASGQL